MISVCGEYETAVVKTDARHGGLDSGCVAVNGAYEKDINLDIVKDLGALLTLAGYEVTCVRTGLLERKEIREILIRDI